MRLEPGSVCACTNVWVEEEINLSIVCVTTEVARMHSVPGRFLAHRVAEIMD